MPSPEPASTTSTAGQPRYPQVRVRMSTMDGPPGILIGKVAVALRRQVGDDAAHACGSHPELLELIRATVRVR